MTRLDYLRLMQLHDEELSAEEAARLEAELGQAGLRESARGIGDGLAQIGDVVRALADLDVQRYRAAADDIAAQVMHCLDDTGAEAFRLAEPTPGGGPNGGSGRSANRWGWIAGVGGALAMAATALIFAWSVGSFPPAPAETQTQITAAGSSLDSGPRMIASVEPMRTPTIDGDPGVAIEMVDFGAQSGTIFMVSAGQEATPVVWLVDEGPASEGRVKQL